MNGLAVVTVTEFQKDGKQFDKNGNQNLWLSPIAGKFPNRALVLNGTRAIQNKIEAGSTYLVSYQEGEVSEVHGRQFNVSKVADMSPLDIMDSIAKLGAATIVDTSKVEAKVEETITADSELA